MINWKYVTPRLVIAVATALALWFGLDPVLRLTLCTIGGRLLGAKVEIGHTHTSLVQTKVCLDDVQIANPASPLKNLVEARHAELDLETSSLLKKKVVVSQGRISGLKFNADRDSSGALDGIHVPKVDVGVNLDEDRLADLAGQWLAASATALRKGLEQELESVRLAKELMHRWPAEYEQLAARAEALERRIKELQSLLENPNRSGPATLDTYRHLTSELDAVHNEIASLRTRLKELPRQAQRDIQALNEAEERDLEHLRRKLWLTNLDADSLSQYLLGPEQGKQVDELIAWVKWARACMPTKVESASVTRGRGETVVFPGMSGTPNFLIRSLKIDGETQLGSELVRFEGEAANLTSQPALLSRPATLALRTLGPTPLTINATLDRTGNVPHDSLQVATKILQPRRVLGRPEQLAVAVSPGAMQLQLRLDLVGEALSGEIHLAQEPVELAPTLAVNYGGEQLARGLHSALAGIRRVDAVVELSGTLDKPQFQLSSNLGPQLATGMQGVFQRELDAGRAELVKQVEEYIDGQLARFDRMLADKEREVASRLNLQERDLAQLSRQLASRTGLSDKVRQKLPGVDLFKR